MRLGEHCFHVDALIQASACVGNRAQGGEAVELLTDVIEHALFCPPLGANGGKFFVGRFDERLQACLGDDQVAVALYPLVFVRAALCVFLEAAAQDVLFLRDVFPDFSCGQLGVFDPSIVQRL
ncbi:hypothetical protein RC55_17940 [Herbaspirillum seropedicae]|nr:hypothetical protein ACP92_04180 [Herbaspirillum seropedicae]NQE31110.1 hypothetical protein [Herbaspirillum seropedicae]